MIDISSCLNSIQTLKGYVSNCFSKCSDKGSTYTGTQSLSNLEMAIDLIPTGSGSSGETVVGANFGGFDVTWAEEPDEEYYTVNFGSYGTGWKALSVYSDSKDGHYNIVKLPNNKCIISGAYFVDLDSEWDENFGIYPMGRGTYRATYSVSGSSMTFTNAEYDGTSNGFDNFDEFKEIVTQVSNTVNDYYTNSYKLDKITVIY